MPDFCFFFFFFFNQTKHTDKHALKNKCVLQVFINLFGYGTVRSKTSSSRDDSLQNHFSNGTVHPGTVRSICKNEIKVVVFLEMKIVFDEL